MPQRACCTSLSAKISSSATGRRRNSTCCSCRTASRSTLLGVTPGSATVLALQNDTAGEVTLVIDRAVLQAPRFGCHPCINTSSLAFSTQDLTEKLLPTLGHAPVLVDLPEDSDA